jgi:outer membrane protein assembly factor BamB
MTSSHITIVTGALICMLSAPAVSQVSTGWKLPFNGSNSEPVVHDGTIYIGSFDGSVYAIDPKSGKPIWHYQTGVGLTSGPEIIVSSGKTPQEMLGAALSAAEQKGKGKREISATPVIENETVYIGSKDFKFYALDAKTGKLRWATDIGHSISRKALVAGETILVHGVDKQPRFSSAIYALQKKDGRVIWSTEGKVGVSFPSASGNVVYYGRRATAERNLHLTADATISIVDAVEISTGKSLWTQEFRGEPPEETFVSSDLVYVSFFKGGEVIRLPNNKGVDFAPAFLDVLALRASSGEQAWKFSAGPFRPSRPPELVAGQEHIYFVAPQGVHAVNKNTGKQDWFLEGTFSQFSMAMGAFLYVKGDSTRRDDQIYAIDTKTGRVVWSYRDKNLFYTRVAADTLYISAEQSLVALDASTGKVLWKFRTGSIFKEGPRVSAASVIFENHVIFPTETNVIWGRDSIQGQLYSVNRVTGNME